MENSKFLGLVVVLSVVLSAQSASSFCRKTTCDNNRDDCDGPVGPECKPLRWPNRCVGFTLQQDASDSISLETFRSVTEKAFLAWLDRDCGYDEGPTVQVQYLGPVSCNVREFNRQGGNANIIMFHTKDWPHEKDIGTLGLATTTFNTKTGEIYDVDIELNAAEEVLTTSADGSGTDLQGVLVHEIGHFFGLAHSSVPNASMYYEYDNDMRSPSVDDHLGLCSIFSDSNPSCDPTPKGGLRSTCGDPPPKDDGGCSFSGRQPASSGNPTLWLGLGLAAAWAARRRSIRRTQ